MTSRPLPSLVWSKSDLVSDLPSETDYFFACFPITRRNPFLHLALVNNGVSGREVVNCRPHTSTSPHHIPRLLKIILSSGRKLGLSKNYLSNIYISLSFVTLLAPKHYLVIDATQGTLLNSGHTQRASRDHSKHSQRSLREHTVITKRSPKAHSENTHVPDVLSLFFQTRYMLRDFETEKCFNWIGAQVKKIDPSVQLEWDGSCIEMEISPATTWHWTALPFYSSSSSFRISFIRGN